MAVDFGTSNSTRRFKSDSKLGDDFNVVEFTYLAAIKLPNAALGSTNRLLGQMVDGNTNGDFFGGIAATNKALTQLVHTSGGSIADNYQSVVADKWILVALRRTADGTVSNAIGIEGSGVVYKGISGDKNTVKLPKEYLIVGNYSDADSVDSFKGILGWVAFCNRFVTDQEISELVTTRRVIGNDIEGLVEIWEFTTASAEITGSLKGIKLNRVGSSYGADVAENVIPSRRAGIDLGIDFKELQSGKATIAEMKAIYNATNNLRLVFADIYSGQAGNFSRLEERRNSPGRFSEAEIDTAVQAFIAAVRTAKDNT